MLERLTSGRYKSALHRVVNHSGRPRLAMPFFFDPRFDAELQPIPGLGRAVTPASGGRWDGIDPLEARGTYGEYLLGKVSKVFPALGREHLHG
jgi:isopenicillin N synthase-like dioxygenase